MTTMISRHITRAALAAIGATALLGVSACSVPGFAKPAEVPADLDLSAAVLNAEDGPNYVDVKQRYKDARAQQEQAKAKAEQTRADLEENLKKLSEGWKELGVDTDLGMDLDLDAESESAPESNLSTGSEDNLSDDNLEEPFTTFRVEPAECDTLGDMQHLQSELGFDNDDVAVSGFNLSENLLTESPLVPLDTLTVRLERFGDFPDQSHYVKCPRVTVVSEVFGTELRTAVEHEVVEVDIAGADDAFAVRSVSETESSQDLALAEAFTAPVASADSRAEDFFSVYAKKGDYLVIVNSQQKGEEEHVIEYATKQLEKLQRLANEQAR